MSSSAAPTADSDPLPDKRRPTYGAGRALIAIYAVFAISASARAAVQLIRNASEAPVAYGLSAVSALVYIVATIAMAHNGRKMRRLAWVSVVTEFLGVVIVGALSLTHPDIFKHDTVWSVFGWGYGFVPLVLPLLGMWWLWWSSPARIVAPEARTARNDGG